MVPERFFLDVPMFVLTFLSFSNVFPAVRLDFPWKINEIQALVKFYMFLTQKFECKPQVAPTFEAQIVRWILSPAFADRSY